MEVFFHCFCARDISALHTLPDHVKLGKNEDVKLVRTGPKRLSVLADNVNFAAGISAKKIALNGVDLTKLLGQGGGGCSGGNTGSGGGGSKKKPEWVYFATDLGGIVRT